MINRHQGQAYRIDPMLGFTLNPDASGAFLMTGGDPVSFHHDQNGLRTVPQVSNALQSGRHPRILFLGDSYTYGMLVATTQTFPYLVASALNGQALNAGVPGWGLAQMLLEAGKTIPRYRPDYVVVQYSSWLVLRSTKISAPGSQGLLMTPYFVDKNDGVSIAPPAFNAASDTMAKMAKYQESIPDWRNKASFIFHLALPYFLHYDTSMLLLKTRVLLGLMPEPTQRSDYVIDDAYAEINKLAKENGAKMIVLALGTDAPMVIPRGLFPKDILLVNAQQALLDVLDQPTEANYAQHYFHWQQDRMVDKHPNAAADKIIAEAVVKQMRLDSAIH
jgi:hypothetical protein